MAHSKSKFLVASDTFANQFREALTLYEVDSLPRRYLGHRTAVRPRPGARAAHGRPRHPDRLAAALPSTRRLASFRIIGARADRLKRATCQRLPPPQRSISPAGQHARSSNVTSRTRVAFERAGRAGRSQGAQGAERPQDAEPVEGGGPSQPRPARRRARSPRSGGRTRQAVHRIRRSAGWPASRRP
jgi:hypothetical protein